MEELLPFDSFSELLKIYRKRKKVTQRQLAKKLGVHYNTVWSWEQGNFLPASRGSIMELARYLQLSNEELSQFLEASLMPHSPYWYVPYQHSPFFTGRNQLLEHLHNILSLDQHETQSCSYALSGMGGIGKTQVAVEFAYRHIQKYTAIFWLQAETEENLFASLKAIANILHFPQRCDTDQNTITDMICYWLNTHPNWLLILDNVERIELVKRILPKVYRGALLFTTRLPELGGLARSIMVEPMPLEEGFQFLLRRSTNDGQQVCGEREMAAAREIARSMDGLPLALDQAGAYIKRTQCLFSTFLRLFEATPITFLERRERHEEHPFSVAATFTCSLQKLHAKCPEAVEMLQLFCFLSYQEIPEEIMKQAIPYLPHYPGEPLSSELYLNNLLSELLAYALIHRDTQFGTITLHKVVQVVLKQRLSEVEQRDWSERVIRLMNQVFIPEQNTLEIEQWPWCEQILPHVHLAIQYGKRWQLVSPELVSLLTKTATYLCQRARYTEAEALSLQASALQEQLQNQSISSASHHERPCYSDAP